ncbi:TetR/AcrR family transcriptional regulator [Nonomuraea sp. ATR24]|uniref:TetR/AcrR family transcriptional regulator n=1 Tax=unclassified Nonomuraea TaxID=2593643 RepID=UPI0034023849
MTPQPPQTGPTRRRTRITDEETARRMLDTATHTVEHTGLTVSLDHLSLEQIIRDAGVARSAVYRRWPYKDLFFSDLLRELAKATNPTTTATDPTATRTATHTLLTSLTWARNPHQRRALAAEALRTGALGEYDLFHRSPAWRTYLALQATFRSLPDGDLRTDVQQALTDAEHTMITGLATTYTHMTRLLGLRPHPGITYETIARLAVATLRGLILMTPANPELTTHRFPANPFGAPEPAEWTEPALAIATVVVGLLEPDPDLTWTDEHERAAEHALRTGQWRET